MFGDLGLNVVRTAHLAEMIPDCLPLSNEDAILLDVGGRISQIFYVKRGKLDGYKTIKQGGADFSEYITENFGLDKTAARQLKEDYSDGNVTPEAEKKLKSLFEPGKSIWKKNVMECKKIEFQNVSIYFFGGGSLLKEIRSVFNRRKIIRPKFLKKIIAEDKEVLKMTQFIPCLLIVLAKNNG
jgi:Ethanolamine utilization protein EutJ (predicted chaperonin)